MPVLSQTSKNCVCNKQFINQNYMWLKVIWATDQAYNKRLFPTKLGHHLTKKEFPQKS